MSGLKGKILIDKDDIVGQYLGRLEIISYSGCHYDKTKGGDKMRHYYNCRCECGVNKKIQRGQLTSKIVHSCGCLRKGKRNGN